MTVGFYSVFLYTTNEFQEVNFSNRICENLCTHLCKDLGITPSARLLFGLRINGTHNWIPEGAELDANIKYDFRLRFKVIFYFYHLSDLLTSLYFLGSRTNNIKRNRQNCIQLLF